MQPDMGRAANVANFLNFGLCVDAAGFGGLCDADARWLHGVDVTHLVAHGGTEPDGIDLGVGSVNGLYLRAARVELWCAAFVIVDVCLGVAENAAPRRRHRGQTQGIGRRSRWNQENAHLTLENVGEHPLDAQSVFVVAVWMGVAGIAGNQGFEHLG